MCQIKLQLSFKISSILFAYLITAHKDNFIRDKNLNDDDYAIAKGRAANEKNNLAKTTNFAGFFGRAISFAKR